MLSIDYFFNKCLFYLPLPHSGGGLKVFLKRWMLDAQNLGPTTPERHNNEVWTLNVTAFYSREILIVHTPRKNETEERERNRLQKKKQDY